jgi:hypothetical protein
MLLATLESLLDEVAAKLADPEISSHASGRG